MEERLAAMERKIAEQEAENRQIRALNEELSEQLGGSSGSKGHRTPTASEASGPAGSQRSGGRGTYSGMYAKRQATSARSPMSVASSIYSSGPSPGVSSRATHPAARAQKPAAAQQPLGRNTVLGPPLPVYGLQQPRDLTAVPPPTTAPAPPACVGPEHAEAGVDVVGATVSYGQPRSVAFRGNQRRCVVSELLGDGTLLLGGDTAAVRRVDLVTGNKLQAYEGHAPKSQVLAVAVSTSPTATTLWSCTSHQASGVDTSILGFDLATGQATAVIDTGTKIRKAVFTLDGARAFTHGCRLTAIKGRASEAEAYVRVWNTATGKQVGSLSVRQGFGEFSDLVLEPKAGLIYTCGSETVRAVTRGKAQPPTHVIRVWNLTSLHNTAVCAGHEAAVRCMLPAPEGTGGGAGGRNWLYTGSDDKTAVRWAISPSSAPITPGTVFRGHTGKVISLHLDGRTLYTGSTDHTARAWHAVTGECRGALRGHRGDVTEVNTSEGYVFTASTDRTVRAWEASSLRCTHKFVQGGALRWPDGAPSQLQLVAGGLVAMDGELVCWPLPSEIPSSSRGPGGGDAARLAAKGGLKPAAVLRFASPEFAGALSRASRSPPGPEVAAQALLVEAKSGFQRGDAMLRLFKSFKADMSARDEQGRTALHHAVDGGEIDIAKVLLSLGAKDGEDLEGFTALHVAALVNSVPAVRLLVKKGSDLDAVTAAGDTALHVAAHANSAAAAAAIASFRRGAFSLGARDPLGRTPVDVARALKHGDVVDVLAGRKPRTHRSAALRRNAPPTSDAGGPTTPHSQASAPPRMGDLAPSAGGGGGGSAFSPGRSSVSGFSTTDGPGGGALLTVAEVAAAARVCGVVAAGYFSVVRVGGPDPLGLQSAARRRARKLKRRPAASRASPPPSPVRASKSAPTTPARSTPKKVVGIKWGGGSKK